MSTLKNPVFLQHSKDFSRSERTRQTLKQTLGRTFRQTGTPLYKPHISNVPLAPANKSADSVMESDFPGNTRLVVAEEAMKHIEENFIAFQSVFADFDIAEYRLMAGFDEDFIRARLGLSNQIHILLRPEPQDIDNFLLRISHMLGSFTAIVFTNKSTYRLLPSDKFYKVAQSAYGQTQSNAGGPSNISGGSSGQGNNGNPDDSRTRKGKERESDDPSIPPDPSKKDGDPDPDPESPGPDSGNAKSAELSFRVSADLLQQDIPLQTLQVRGALKIKRTPESQDLPQFATCIVEFTELHTTSMSSQSVKYHHFQLDIRIDAKGDEFVYVSKAQPLSTPEYNPESKVSNGTKKISNFLASAKLSLLPLKATIGGSGSRTREQSANTERVVNTSRIVHTQIVGVTHWMYHLVDRFEQESGLDLSPEKLPLAHITFGGHEATPPPPSAFLGIEITTYWTILPTSSGAWPTSLENKARFSNIAQITSLNLPKNMQGPHLYICNLLAHVDMTPIELTVKSVVQSHLGKAIVAETRHTSNSSV